MEQAHLADVLAGATHRDQALVGGAERLDDLDLTIDHNIEAIAVLALVEEDGARWDRAWAQRLGQVPQLVVRKRGEQRNLADQRFVGDLVERRAVNKTQATRLERVDSISPFGSGAAGGANFTVVAA